MNEINVLKVMYENNYCRPCHLKYHLLMHNIIEKLDKIFDKIIQMMNYKFGLRM